MHIAIGNDHRGVKTKQSLVAHLQAAGHEVEDCGVHDGARVDYPDLAAEVCRRVVTGQVDRGILVCGSGIGMCIAANKASGVRAVVSYDLRAAEASRRHNDANVLCLSGDWIDNDLNASVTDVWLTTPFEGGRHALRVDKISGIERSRPE